MTQHEKVFNYMKENGKISQRQAYKMGIYRLSAVIFDLKQGGIKIMSERVKCRNRDGTFSYPSFYWLANSEKKKG